LPGTKGKVREVWGKKKVISEWGKDKAWGLALPD